MEHKDTMPYMGTYPKMGFATVTHLLYAVTSMVPCGARWLSCHIQPSQGRRIYPMLTVIVIGRGTTGFYLVFTFYFFILYEF
jgi:hypothetical protein